LGESFLGKGGEDSTEARWYSSGGRVLGFAEQVGYSQGNISGPGHTRHQVHPDMPLFLRSNSSAHFLRECCGLDDVRSSHSQVMSASANIRSWGQYCGLFELSLNNIKS